MKHRRANLSLVWLVSLCGLALQFSPVTKGANEEPLPSATSGSKGETWPELQPCVKAVGVHSRDGDKRGVNTVYAQRGDVVWVDVYNFEAWVNSLAKEKKPHNHEIKDLILYLDHFALVGVSPAYWHESEYYTAKSSDGKWPSTMYKVTTVGFPLVRTNSSKSGWAHLLNQPVFRRKVIVSVGFSNGAEMDSTVTHDEKTTGGLDQQFFLTIIPHWNTAFGLIVILSSLVTFLALARRTDIIRDVAAPRRPDGKRPYSLARGQMAFWFFLVIASYFFLWIVTGDMDTLNTSVLGLIGISAGTALGAAFVDCSKPVSADSSGNQPIVDVTQPRLEVLAELKKLQTDTKKGLESLQKMRASISSSNKRALEENEREQNEVRERLANYRWQSVYFAWPRWKGVLYDLIAENNLISFHRFQIFVWTLILGIMFIASVYNELAMPEFSATLLGLLGISAGTYVGFKLPEAKVQ